MKGTVTERAEPLRRREGHCLEHCKERICAYLHEPLVFKKKRNCKAGPRCEPSEVALAAAVVFDCSFCLVLFNIT